MLRAHSIIAYVHVNVYILKCEVDLYVDKAINAVWWLIFSSRLRQGDRPLLVSVLCWCPLYHVTRSGVTAHHCPILVYPGLTKVYTEHSLRETTRIPRSPVWGKYSQQVQRWKYLSTFVGKQLRHNCRQNTFHYKPAMTDVCWCVCARACVVGA